MALDKTTLQKDLLAIFDGSAWPGSISVAANKWATAYDNYAQKGTDVAIPAGNVPLTTVAAKTTLIVSLNTAFTAGMAIGDPNSVATMIATALTTYWLVPPMMFAIVTPILPVVAVLTNVVTGVLGTAALQLALLSIFVDKSPSTNAAQKAQVVANAMDVFSKTVTGLMSGTGSLGEPETVIWTLV